MRCPNCGKEFSPKVWRIHKTRCTANARDSQSEYTKSDLIALAELEGVEVDKRWSKSRIVEALNGG